MLVRGIRSRRGQARELATRVVDRAIFAFGGSSARPTHHLLVGPPGGGNIGDQAMVESFVSRVPGAIVVVLRDPSNLTISPADQARVVVATLPSLLYGRGGAGHFRDVRAFSTLLRGARSLSIIGADIMDGAYGARASARRAFLAEMGARAGVPTRVLGFSWNGRADPAALQALRRAAAHGARLLVRDPVSARRALADGLHGVEASADLVFGDRRLSNDAVAEFVRPAWGSGPLALVNVSALVGGGFDQLADYVEIVRHLRAKNLQVLLVPHVSRPGSDDLAACARVFDAVRDADVVLVDRLLSPQEIRGLCERARLVVTGRMHLAIMALSLGRPAITFSTQGKVEGLMELFGAGFLMIEPRAGMASDVVALIDRVEADHDAIVLELGRRLPEVEQLSAGNVRGL